MIITDSMNRATKSKQKKPDNYGRSVLLIEEYPSDHSPLVKALKDFNYHVTKYSSCSENIISQIERCNPNMLILSTNQPNEKMFTELAEINKLLPLPIIIFAENESPNVIENAIRSGVSAYIVHEILPQRIKSIISVANARFKENQALRDELNKTKTQLESRKLVERAKGLLMQQKKISEDEAYDAMRKMAMNQGNSLAIVAKNIIDVCEVLSTP
jgi:response regulator NasT